jgi:hypothetical protein
MSSAGLPFATVPPSSRIPDFIHRAASCAIEVNCIFPGPEGAGTNYG